MHQSCQRFITELSWICFPFYIHVQPTFSKSLKILRLFFYKLRFKAFIVVILLFTNIGTTSCNYDFNFSLSWIWFSVCFDWIKTDELHLDGTCISNSKLLVWYLCKDCKLITVITNTNLWTCMTQIWFILCK